MGGEVADEIEMLAKPRIGEHAPRIAANRKDLALFDQVMSIKLEGVGLLRQAALVDDCLALVLASRLKPVELEQPVGRREELGLAELPLHRLVLDVDGLVSHEPRGEKAARFAIERKSFQ